MTNRTGYLIIGLLLIAIAGAVALLVWALYTTPLGPPIVVYRALPGDYRQYWGWIGAGFGFAALVVIVELGGIWWELHTARKAK